MSSQNISSVTVQTQAYEGQKPGTSGLRKAVKVYKQQHYTENFVQCTITAALDKLLQQKSNCSLVIGGDGRYYEKEATLKIIQICAGNGVSIMSGRCNWFSFNKATTALETRWYDYLLEHKYVLTRV